MSAANSSNASLTGAKAVGKRMEFSGFMRSILYPPPRLTISTSGISRATSRVSRAAFCQMRQSLPDPTCECNREILNECRAAMSRTSGR